MAKIVIILKNAPILLSLTTLKHKKRALILARLLIGYSILLFFIALLKNIHEGDNHL